jgi:hypothetical protein
MTRPIITIAGESREMNDEELAQWEKDQIDFANKKAKQLEAEAERQAILDRIGLTADEAKLILG